ncbi:MAG TPA: phosphate ABC transporter permease subunit PstC [Nitrososphaeraceae archaeon]|nr:phosphate ABC transporter permease subunit PstC [Nitrososphaeraceae archaeon]
MSTLFVSRERRHDKLFSGLVVGAAAYTLLMVGLVVFSVGRGSIDIFSAEGLEFIIQSNWNAVEGRESFGAFPYIIGTLLSSAIAMVIGVPISLAIAIFISEIAPPRIGTPLSFLTELLAAVPSIIYGLWALFVFRFWVRDLIEKPLYDAFGGSIPFFAKTPFGLDIFTAGIVLAIMIIPIISSICREVMRVVPDSQREAAYSLGATRWETIRMAVFPYVKSGLVGASMLGLGRAVGETILVTMIIGNVIGPSAIPTTFFSQGQTLSSLIANEFNEASSELHLSALIALGAILLILTMGINIIARLLVRKKIKTASGAKSQ